MCQRLQLPAPPLLVGWIIRVAAISMSLSAWTAPVLAYRPFVVLGHDTLLHGQAKAQRKDRRC